MRNTVESRILARQLVDPDSSLHSCTSASETCAASDDEKAFSDDHSDHMGSPPLPVWHPTSTKLQRQSYSPFGMIIRRWRSRRAIVGTLLVILIFVFLRVGTDGNDDTEDDITDDGLAFRVSGEQSRVSALLSGMAGRLRFPGSCASAPPRVHVLVPLDSSSEGSCLTLASMIINDYQPILLNWGGERHHFAKVQMMRNYLLRNTTAGEAHPDREQLLQHRPSFGFKKPSVPPPAAAEAPKSMPVKSSNPAPASALAASATPVDVQKAGDARLAARAAASLEADDQTLRQGGITSPLTRSSSVITKWKSTEKCQREDIVIALDGLDIWAQRNLASVLADFARSRKRVIYAAEKPCFPELDLDDPVCGNVPKSTLPDDIYGHLTDDDVRRGGMAADNVIWRKPRYVNSGFVIGYAKTMLPIYIDATFMAERLRREKPEMIFDQGLMHPLHAMGNYSISVDYHSRFIQTLGWSLDDVFLAPATDAMDTASSSRVRRQLSWLARGIESPWVVWNKITKVIPAFVHFNGVKGLHRSWWAMTWWGGMSGRLVVNLISDHLETHGSVTLDDGRKLSWNEVCGKHWPPKPKS